MAKDSKALTQKLGFLPQSPGIYMWKDQEGQIIYVGKALNLQNRIRSYLSGTPKDIKTQQLVAHIADLDYILTNTESEAFLLEANLVKEHQPKYNILLKDDKRYPYVILTVSEPFPRLYVTRDLVKDGSSYYGPYTDVRTLRRVLRHLEWIFPLRTCARNIPLGVVRYKKACINYQLKKCPAPCVGYITKADYALIVKRAQDFFKGRYQELMDEFRSEMTAYSDTHKYEQAAIVRDQMHALENIQKRQAVSNPDHKNIDIIGFYLEENIAISVVLKMINGKILNQETYPLKNLQYSTKEQALYAFINLYYSSKEELPDEILLPFDFEELDELRHWLKVKISLPQKGDRHKLIAMAKRNAFHLVEEQKLAHLRKANRTIFPIQELKEKLSLPRLPRKMVCMDISTIQGTDTVSSAVYFENGKPKKKSYRHFIIKSIDSQNDFAALEETMLRYLLELDKDPTLKPDLFVIDGGKGQLSISSKILQASPYMDIPIISLAKRIEEIYLPSISDPLILPKSSSSMRLLTSVRDEAHRFAITFHRSRRSKRTLVSELEAIDGVGQKNKFLLLKHFGSVEAIALASVDELCEVKGIGTQIAQKIVKYFQSQGQST